MANGTTTKQDKEFIDNVIKPAIETNLLESVIEHLAKNFAPDDVFDEDVLETWALENGFVKEDS